LSQLWEGKLALKRFSFLLIVIFCFVIIAKSAKGAVIEKPYRVPVIFSNCEEMTADPDRPIRYIHDNNPNTIWSTKACSPPTSWFEVTLKDSVFVDYIKVEGQSIIANDVSIMYYETDGSFQPIIGSQHISLVNGIIDLSGYNVRTNRLKLIFNNSVNHTTLGNISEMEVFGHNAEYGRLQCQVAASSEDINYPARFLSDKNTNTAWRATNSDSFIDFKLQNPVVVNKVKFFNRNAKGVITLKAQLKEAWVDIGSTINLNVLSTGWQSVEIPQIETKALRMEFSGSYFNLGGIGEVELWGEDSTADKKILLLGENLTGADSFGFELKSLSLWEQSVLWLSIPSNMAEFSPEIKLNGVKLSYIPQVITYKNGKLIKIPLQLDMLREGRNSISLNLASNQVQQAVFMLARDTGKIDIRSINSPSKEDIMQLYDGKKFENIDNIAGINTLDIDLNGVICIDAIAFHSESEASFDPDIRILLNNIWVSVPGNKVKCDGTFAEIVGGIAPLSKLRIYCSNMLDLSEIKVYGSIYNSGPPEITITSPPNYALINDSIVNIEGFVDNPEASLSIDGEFVNLQGHFFKHTLNISSQKNGLCKKTVVAKSPQNQSSEKTVCFYINKDTIVPIPTLTCDFKDGSYITQSEFMFYVKAINATLVRINSKLANKDGEQFCTKINLEEGENLISIEAENANGVAVHLTRRIILDTKAPKLELSEKLIQNNRVFIKGTCIDSTPVAIKVNQNPAPITDNVFYFSTNNLNPGKNIITVTARDLLGHESSMDVEVNIDSSNSLILKSVSADNETDTSYDSINKKYCVPLIGNAENDVYKSYFSNNAENVSTTSGGLDVSVTDLTLPGKSGLDLIIKRIYNSNSAHQEFISEKAAAIDKLPGEQHPERQYNPIDMFGNGWALNIPWLFKIEKDDYSIEKYIRLADGSAVKYQLNNNVFYHHEGVRFEFKFEPSANQYVLTFKDGSKYIFDSQGRVIAQCDSSGKNKIEFFYNNRELSFIRDSLGREVIFTYKSECGKRVIGSISTGGKTVSYNYNQIGLLSEAVDPKNRKTIYKYKDFGEQTIGSVTNVAGWTTQCTKSLEYVDKQVCGWRTTYQYECRTVSIPVIEQICIPDPMGGTPYCYNSTRYETQLECGNYPVETYDCWIEQELQWVDHCTEVPYQYCIDNTFNYPLRLLEEIDYPTQGKSLYTYTLMSQGFATNFEENRFYASFIYNGQKPVVSKHELGTKLVNYSYEMNAQSGKILDDSFQVGNQIVINSTVTEEGKTEKYSYQHVYKKDSNYYQTQTPNKDDYIGPILVCSQLNKNDVEVENVKYSYDLDSLQPTNEQHFRSNQMIYELSSTYDDWGNTVTQYDSRKENYELSHIYYSHSIYKNLPQTSTVKNYNPITKETKTLTTNYTYFDDIGKPKTIIVSDGKNEHKTTYTYYDDGSLRTEELPNGLVNEYIYNHFYGSELTANGSKPYLGSLISKTANDVENADGSDQVTTYKYVNYFGLNDYEVDPNGFVTFYEYDELNRVKKVILPDDDDSCFPKGDYSTFQSVQLQRPSGNPVREYIYDDENRTMEYWNENRQKTKYVFDEYGRLIDTINFVNSNRYTSGEIKTTYSYDEAGRLKSVIDPRKNTTWYEYDALGRLSKIIYPKEVPSDTSVFARLDYDDITNTLYLNRENGAVIEEVKDWSDQLIQATQYCDFESSQEILKWSFKYDTAGNQIQENRPLGTYSYDYDAFGRMIKTTLPDIPVVEPGTTNKSILQSPGNSTPILINNYNIDGQLTEQIKANENYRGNVDSYTENKYDRLGRLTEIILKNQNGSIVGITKNFYNAAGNKVKTIDANNHEWKYTYSVRGWLLSEEDPCHNLKQYRYDPMGNKIATIDPRNSEAAPIIWYTINADGSVALKDPRLNRSFTTWTLYDELNRSYRTVLPDDSSPSAPFGEPSGYDNPYTEIWYDLAGNKIKERDPNGVETVYTYTSRNWLESVVSQSKTEKYEYDNIGNQTKVERLTDNTNNYIITKDYDSLGRLRRVTYPQGTEEYNYDPLGNQTSVKDGNQHVTQYHYNNLGWLTEAIDPMLNKTQYRYDPNGNQLATLTADNLFRIKRYDEQNRIVEDIDTLGKSTITKYDAVGNCQEVIDRRGTKWTYEYLDNNWLKQLSLSGTDNKTYDVIYEYDPAGNRIKISDTSSIGNIITYEPDAQNRFSLIKQAFDGKLYQTEYTYNKSGQLTGIKYPAAISNVVYNYSSSGLLEEVVGFTQPNGINYDSDGLVNTIKYINGVTTIFAYDVNRKIQNLNVSSGAQALMDLSYVYDLAGNVTQNNESVSGQQNSFTYFDNNWLQSENAKSIHKEEVKGVPGYVQPDMHGDQGLDFIPRGVVSLDYATTSVGIDFGGEYTPTIKMIQLVPDKDHQTNRISSRGIDIYTSEDNCYFTLISRTDWEYQKGSDGVITLTLKEPVKFRYIKVHSLYNDTVDGNPVDKATFLNDLAKMIRMYEVTEGTKITQYQYTKGGNRSLKSVKLVDSKKTNYFYYPDSDRLLTDEEYAYIYDLAGNMVEKGNKFDVTNGQVTFVAKTGEGVLYWKYEYDLMNRLINVYKNGTKVVEYGYNPDGLRVVKRAANGETTHYVFEGTEPIFEKQINSGKVKSYVYALGKHLVRVDGFIGDTTAKVYYYHTDQTGSIQKITDSQGIVVWDSDYSAFGSQFNQSGSIEEFHSFTGKELDADTGLYYFNSRWYDSELGRFISEDPAQDGLNWYIYCRNNPTKYVDPTGEFIWTATLGLGAGILDSLCSGIYAAFTGGDVGAAMAGGFTSGFITGAAVGFCIDTGGTGAAIFAAGAAGGFVGGYLGSALEQGMSNGIEGIDPSKTFYDGVFNAVTTVLPGSKGVYDDIALDMLDYLTPKLVGSELGGSIIQDTIWNTSEYFAKQLGQINFNNGSFFGSEYNMLDYSSSYMRSLYSPSSNGNSFANYHFQPTWMTPGPKTPTQSQTQLLGTSNQLTQQYQMPYSMHYNYTTNILNSTSSLNFNLPQSGHGYSLTLPNYSQQVQERLRLALSDQLLYPYETGWQYSIKIPQIVIPDIKVQVPSYFSY
jgi:RHS repeat-associated protein